MYDEHVLWEKDIFLTTKVWIEHYGYEPAKSSVLKSMEKLKTDYLDLVLLHQPFSDAYGAWRALEELYEEGRVRAIGISNFYADRMVDFASFNRIRPMVNQVETHIFNQQKTAREWMDKYGVQIEAWAPFGEGRGGTFDHPVIAGIAARHGKTPAQVMPRWTGGRALSSPTRTPPWWSGSCRWWRSAKGSRTAPGNGRTGKGGSV